MDVGLRFRQRIKVFPGVHINWSLSGFSVSIGGPGATVNVGKGMQVVGTVGLPGTGLSYRQTIIPSNTARRGATTAYLDGQVEQIAPADAARDPNIPNAISATERLGSAPLSEVAQGGMIEVQTLIAEAYRERVSLEREISDLRDAVGLAKSEAQRLQRWWMKLFQKKRAAHAVAAVESASANLAEAEEALAHQGIRIDWSLPAELTKRYSVFLQNMAVVGRAGAIWHLTGRANIDRASARTLHTSVIDRKRASITLSRPPFLPTLRTDPIGPVPSVTSEAGMKLHFFPSFLMISRGAEFAVLDYRSVDINVDDYSIIETESVPHDANISGNTWRYVNKDGTPDRRYNDNYQIPIVAYQSVHITGDSGLDEMFLLSSNAYNFAAFVGLKEWCEEMAMRPSLLANAVEGEWKERCDESAQYLVHDWEGAEFVGFGVTKDGKQIWACLSTEHLGISLTPSCRFDLWVDDCEIAVFAGTPTDEFHAAFLLWQDGRENIASPSFLETGTHLRVRVIVGERELVCVLITIANAKGLLRVAFSNVKEEH